MTTASTEDVVDLLTAQHERIKDLFAQLKSGLVACAGKCCAGTVLG